MKWLNKCCARLFFYLEQLSQFQNLIKKIGFKQGAVNLEFKMVENTLLARLSGSQMLEKSQDCVQEPCGVSGGSEGMGEAAAVIYRTAIDQ